MFLSDVIEPETRAVNQRGEDVMAGRAEVALPSRNALDRSPAHRRARP